MKSRVKTAWAKRGCKAVGGKGSVSQSINESITDEFVEKPPGLLNISKHICTKSMISQSVCSVFIRACWEWQSKVFQKPTSNFCCHLVYRLGIDCKKNPKSFSGQEIDLKTGPNHWKVKISRRLNIDMWGVYPDARDWNVGAVCSDFNLGECISTKKPQHT